MWVVRNFLFTSLLYINLFCLFFLFQFSSSLRWHSLRETCVPSRITGSEFAIPWAWRAVSSVLVFQVAIFMAGRRFLILILPMKTKRRLHDRKTEHFKALSKNCQTSAIADHITLILPRFLLIVRVGSELTPFWGPRNGRQRPCYARIRLLSFRGRSFCWRLSFGIPFLLIVFIRIGGLLLRGS